MAYIAINLKQLKLVINPALHSINKSMTQLISIYEVENGARIDASWQLKANPISA